MLWNTLLDPLFLIPAGLVLAGFLPLAIHIWNTFNAGGSEQH